MGMSMKPKLTGGTARGRPLPTPIPSGVRPTASRVREALFSMVGQDLSGWRVLDAFGGAGLLGLESWSRGAEVVVVELNPQTARCIETNARQLGADLQVRVGDVLALAPGLGTFELVLADPPYRDDPRQVVGALAPVTADWLVLETDEGTAAPEAPAGLVLDRRRVYGGTALVIYRRAPLREGDG
jgi:16S rRNA (guanine966-N2)-methyltransferase